MGIYVFSVKGHPRVKIGHFKVRMGGPGRRKILMDNPWYRVSRRGFSKVVHPADIEGFLEMSHLELVAWYPNLSTKEEKHLHKRWQTGSCGEFYPREDLPSIVAFLNTLDSPLHVGEEGKQRAAVWTGQQSWDDNLLCPGM